MKQTVHRYLPSELEDPGILLHGKPFMLFSGIVPQSHGSCQITGSGVMNSYILDFFQMVHLIPHIVKEFTQTRAVHLCNIG